VLASREPNIIIFFFVFVFREKIKFQPKLTSLTALFLFRQQNLPQRLYFVEKKFASAISWIHSGKTILERTKGLQKYWHHKRFAHKINY
jgi:hypothetical protein